MFTLKVDRYVEFYRAVDNWNVPDHCKNKGKCILNNKKVHSYDQIQEISSLPIGLRNQLKFERELKSFSSDACQGGQRGLISDIFESKDIKFKKDEVLKYAPIYLRRWDIDEDAHMPGIAGMLGKIFGTEEQKNVKEVIKPDTEEEYNKWLPRHAYLVKSTNDSDGIQKLRLIHSKSKLKEEGDSYKYEHSDPCQEFFEFSEGIKLSVGKMLRLYKEGEEAHTLHVYNIHYSMAYMAFEKEN